MTTAEGKKKASNGEMKLLPMVSSLSLPRRRLGSIHRMVVPVAMSGVEASEIGIGLIGRIKVITSCRVMDRLGREVAVVGIGFESILGLSVT